MNKKHSEYSLNLINKLTLEEKIALVSGHDVMYTNAVPRLNIPAIRMSDGPHGLRVLDAGDNGAVGTSKATCFPSAATSSNSWNKELLKEMGYAMGKEARYYGINVILGPGVNIKRNPLCGRNFEYFSEDPLLAGTLALGEVEGIQAEGVDVSIKHFAMNNEENHRFLGESVADERAIREIYLKPFEHVVRNAHPGTIMNAYNKINGTYCAENKWLLTDVLRYEWGFNGLVMTDWGATHDRIAALKAGNDLEMPGDSTICRKWIYDAVNNGELDIEILNERVLNVLDLASKHVDNKKLDTVDWKKHHLLSQHIAEESAVLLKNDGLLPLNKKEKLCIIGELFEKMRYQGSGSSMVTSSFITTNKDAFDINEVDYIYFKGYKDSDSNPSDYLIKEAIEATKTFDKVILFAGLTDYEESEGGDRDNMSLPKNQLALIDALIKEHKKIILVLFGGSVVELPFYNDINAMLNMFLPGQNGGMATYNILFGNVNPSGKLSETWPLEYKDVPFNEEFGNNKRMIYKESIYVGYRYYLSANKEVRFPFGYGLSYTKFEYSGLNIINENDSVKIRFTVKNIGKYDGKEIAQIYVKGPDSNFFKPLRELIDFTKILVKSGKEEKVELIIDKNSLKHWNIKDKKYVLEDGSYTFQVGRNSRDIVLEQKVAIKGTKLDQIYDVNVVNIYKNLNFAVINDDLFEDLTGFKIPASVKEKRLTLQSRLTDLNNTIPGRFIYNAILKPSTKQLNRAKKMPDGVEKDNCIKGALSVMKMMENNSLITMSMASSGQFPYNYSLALMHLANWNLLKALKSYVKKIKAPKLPIEG